MLSLLIHLSFGLDGCSLVQEDLDDAHMAVPGSTVQRGQLILTGTEKKTGEDIFSCMLQFSFTVPLHQFPQNSLCVNPFDSTVSEDFMAKKNVHLNNHPNAPLGI